MLLGTPRLLIGPEQLKGFLQVPGPHHAPARPSQRATAPPADLLVKIGRYCRFGSVVADAHQNPPLQIVDHREIHLALTSTHLVDTNHMDRRTLTVTQPVVHGALHN